MSRLIVERNPHGDWEAFIEGSPEIATTAGAIRFALVQLCKFHGLNVARFIEAERSADRVVYRERTREELRQAINDTLPLGREVCGDCQGSGSYTGLQTIETCHTCGGMGVLLD